MSSTWHPFLLVRPCGIPFVNAIRSDLDAAGLVTDHQEPVTSWREVSRRLYFDQYGATGTEWLLQDGAEAWLETTVALYGNTALCLHFRSDLPPDQRLDLAHRLVALKQDFRRRRRAQRIRITVTYTASHGAWPIYFDGVHVPEPDPSRIDWELGVIDALGRTPDPARIPAIPASRGATHE